MKKIQLLYIALFLVGILNACSTTSPKITKNSDLNKSIIPPTPGLNICKTYKEAGFKMLPSIIKGIKENNYALYSRDFSVNNKRLFNKDVFDEAMAGIKEEIGNLIATQYIGEWQKKDINVQLWKAKFSKTKDDILIEMYIKKINNKYKIAGLKLF